MPSILISEFSKCDFIRLGYHKYFKIIHKRMTSLINILRLV